jgi:hypothetical protein
MDQRGQGSSARVPKTSSFVPLTSSLQAPTVNQQKKWGARVQTVRRVLGIDPPPPSPPLPSFSLLGTSLYY